MNETTQKARGYAMLDPKGRIIVNSVRATLADVRLAAGEGSPVPVEIVQVGSNPYRWDPEFHG